MLARLRVGMRQAGNGHFDYRLHGQMIRPPSPAVLPSVDACAADQKIWGHQNPINPGTPGCWCTVGGERSPLCSHPSWCGVQRIEERIFAEQLGQRRRPRTCIEVTGDNRRVLAAPHQPGDHLSGAEPRMRGQMIEVCVDHL